MGGRREEVLSWDETFMRMAHIIKGRSKDPSTQVGACVVSEDNRILTVGYNGAPNGFDDDSFPWAKSGSELDTKYPYVVHAERNAILNFRGSIREFTGATVYVTMFPCNECAKELIQVGIKEVVYETESLNPSAASAIIASRILLETCGIKTRQFSVDLDDFPVSADIGASTGKKEDTSTITDEPRENGVSFKWTDAKRSIRRNLPLEDSIEKLGGTVKIFRDQVEKKIK